MSKYIDAEKIPWTDLNDGRGGVNVYVTFLEKVARMPAADVAEVRHGRWENDGHTLACSNCHTINIRGIAWNYCPNCGARMDE